MKTNRTALIIFIIGLAAFLLYIIPNAQGIRDEHMLSILSQDESIQYPYLVHMLTLGANFFETLKNFVSYQHYFYGYLFYLYSALVVLPFRILFGSQFSSMTQVNLLVLRQLVSVLPTLVAAGLLTWLQTRFRSAWKSILLFIFLLLVPALLLNNLWFWHPDGLVLLGVALTLFFLDRDQYRLGRDFYLGAIACGATAAVKVIGFFFFLAVVIYLLMALRQRKLNLGQVLRPAMFFLIIVLAVFVLLNPLMLIPQTRAQILKVQLQQNYFVTHGWEDEDVYATGLGAWLPYLEQWYALPIFIFFLLFSLGWGCWKNRTKPIYWLILGWIIPYSLYLIFFVATKPSHYWLPTFIPLLSNAFVLIPDELFSKQFNAKQLGAWLSVLAFALLGLQSADYLRRDALIVRRTLEKERLLLACNSEAENKADGQTVSLDPARWYRLETYDSRTQPASRQFETSNGSSSVTAFNDHGQLAWGCANEAEARFSADRSAELYREAHPKELVTFLNP
jgi:hypothetical protein